MAEIDHDLRRQSRFGEAFFHLSNMLRAIVWRFTAAQNDMAVAVAAGIHNRRMTPFSDGEEAMRRAGGVDGVNGDFNRAISTIFKTVPDKRGQTPVRDEPGIQ